MRIGGEMGLRRQDVETKEGVVGVCGPLLVEIEDIRGDLQQSYLKEERQSQNGMLFRSDGAW